MKLQFKFLLLLLLLVPTTLIAQGVEVPSSEGLIVWLTPFIVLGATALVKIVKANLSGTLTLLIVTVLSVATTWITNLVDASAGNWLVQFGLGLVSVFIHQFYKQLKTEN